MYPLLINGISVNLYRQNTDTVKKNSAALPSVGKKICLESKVRDYLGQNHKLKIISYAYWTVHHLDI